jgi:hypothetical protein
MEWETRELKFEQGAGARVFQCEVLLKPAARVGRRWLNIDGIVLGDGRVMLNKAETVRQSALHAGLDGAAIVAALTNWVAERAVQAAPLLAAAGAE